MAKTEFWKDAWNQSICDAYSFRGLISRNGGFDNLNFSKGGACNQSRFRLAENFFCSPKFNLYQEKYDSIHVLWGITSLSRGEFYIPARKKMETILYAQDKSAFIKHFLANHFDLYREMSLVYSKMRFWNDYFKLQNIKNLWFDTFNHHDYLSLAYFENAYPELIDEYNKCAGPDWPKWGENFFRDFDQIDEHLKKEILDHERWNFYLLFLSPLRELFGHDLPSRDLLSQLCLKTGISDMDQNYHESSWEIDSNRVKFLLNQKLLNPFTFHPTRKAHEIIAEMLGPHV